MLICFDANNKIRDEIKKYLNLEYVFSKSLKYQVTLKCVT